MKSVKKNIGKKADISMQTIVAMVIGLAVLLVVLGILGFQTKKGSGKLNDISDSATDAAESSMCMGSDGSYIYKCQASCDSGEEVDKKCLIPDTKCCKIPKK